MFNNAPFNQHDFNFAPKHVIELGPNAYKGGGRVGRIIKEGEYPWWDDFEEPQPKGKGPRVSADQAISELAGELDFSTANLRRTKTKPQSKLYESSLELKPSLNIDVRATVEYVSSVNLDSSIGFKVNSYHERWSDQVWQLQQSVAEQNKLIKTILLMKLLD